MHVITEPQGKLRNYVYTVIFAKYKDKWLYCRAKTRQVFETAGGHIEPGETPLMAAKRELYEETGVTDFAIMPAFDYAVTNNSTTTNGKVFYAEVKTLGEMPNHEMAEVALFDSLPTAMRFPEITPVLYKHLQGWLNIRSAEDERMDIYDINRKFTGRTHRRGDPLPDSDYRLVVVICVINSQGQFLLTKRAPNKGYGGLWEFPGGSAIAGDDSLTAALREANEEAGITLQPEKGRLLTTLYPSNTFFDVWLFKQDFDIEDIVLQPGETVDAKLATIEEVRAIVAKGEFVPCSFLDKLAGV